MTMCSSSSEAPKPAGDAPQFIEVFESMNIAEKKTMTLRVKLAGKPQPTVKWYR